MEETKRQVVVEIEGGQVNVLKAEFENRDEFSLMMKTLLKIFKEKFPQA